MIGGGIGTAAFTMIPPPQLFLNCILIFSGNGVVSDIIITASLCYGLWKSKTGWEATDRLVGRLIWYALETQLPPTLS